MGLSLEETQRIMKTWKHPISLDTPVGESEDSAFGDFLEDGSEHTPSESAMHKLLKDKINHVLKSLTYREREIIKLRYGLGDGYTYTLEEVGRIFKVTRERVRQIEAKASASCSTTPAATISAASSKIPDGEAGVGEAISARNNPAATAARLFWNRAALHALANTSLRSTSEEVRCPRGH